MKRPLLLLLLTLLSACDFSGPSFATEKEKHTAMHAAVFDKQVIAGMSRYNDLRDFLLRYADTIVAYRNARNYVIETDGKTMDTVLQSSECYTFFQGNPNYDIANVPDFLKLKLDSLYHDLGEGNVLSFGICESKQLYIQVKNEKAGDGLYISHELLWNYTMGRDYKYDNNRDSLIGDNCIYRLGLREEHGH
ncbi:hypothetical protein SAMN05428949_0196 [Chitinophaga sp. YR627]|uniref:hypothetical protein n=1 Tax=Chitinophaga sp. YR627 TaxID=1881041 RepID=UPI0008E2C706|nr:hypothetical protein [Chitinophaga sp. YR627]SFM61939.1 hypothetical protein SAMN05428949_0196 [Chitinophaga sp. YR627]